MVSEQLQEQFLKPLSIILNKEPCDFQRQDILKIIKDKNICQINLHYIGLDGKMKELKIPICDLPYAELILAQGERIDGSSIFKGIIPSSFSDLYIVPVYKTAFLSPFEKNTIGIMCKIFDKNGELATCAPDNILLKAAQTLEKKTGYTLNVLGELEFYIIYDHKDHLFRGKTQRGYHQSSPFVKSKKMLNEMMQIISALTGSIKYGHAEVGYIDSLKSTNEEIQGKRCEQYEIEFLPRPIHDMAMYLTLSKWVIRNVAYKWGCSATFTPKLEEGMAGNGLHFHIELLKNGTNQMTNQDGTLSDISKKLIGGLCKYAPSMTAFGNTVSSAFLRLVSNQEAPTKICWSEQSRNALIRIPLGWSNVIDMEKKANSNQKNIYKSTPGSRQTIELRSPDGSAHINLFLAAIARVAEESFNSSDSLKIAEKLHVNSTTLKNEKYLDSLESLPSSCDEAADALLEHRNFFQKDGLFPEEIIDYIIKKLRYEKDRNINSRFSQLTADQRLKATRDIMHKDLHKH